MPAPRPAPDDNPFRANSPRKVWSRARERWQLVTEWLRTRKSNGDARGEHPARKDQSSH